MRLAVRSLQAALVWRLTAVFALATAAAVGAVVYEAFEVAGSLDDRTLIGQARELAAFAKPDGAGGVWLDLPPEQAAVFGPADGGRIYAVRDAAGRIVASSPPAFGALVETWGPADGEPGFFRLRGFGPRQQGYYGLAQRFDTAAGPVSVTVAQVADTDAFLHSVVFEFASDIAWIVPVVLLLTLAVGVYSVRTGLRPLREASARAAAIGPESTGVRLPEETMPVEIRPLVAAVNRALDRLEEIVVMQRRFMANAAHELRTPLAVLTAEIEMVGGNGRLASIRDDVARINRLVDQLLRVARLDSVTLDLSAKVDLRATAAAVVEAMAPLAIRAGRTLALDAPQAAVSIRGNADAIQDAVRNLVENALAHAPAGTEVTVRVDPKGSVTVNDRGPGVPEADRMRIFERFWRGPGRRGNGAGLGLAIVREIMQAHGGSVTVADNPGGGMSFTLIFEEAAAVPKPRRQLSF